MIFIAVSSSLPKVAALGPRTGGEDARVGSIFFLVIGFVLILKG
jgi:hypothetical protein